jgi:hypothetical protein
MRETIRRPRVVQLGKTRHCTRDDRTAVATDMGSLPDRSFGISLAHTISHCTLHCTPKLLKSQELFVSARNYFTSFLGPERASLAETAARGVAIASCDETKKRVTFSATRFLYNSTNRKALSRLAI